MTQSINLFSYDFLDGGVINLLVKNRMSVNGQKTRICFSFLVIHVILNQKNNTLSKETTGYNFTEKEQFMLIDPAG